MKLHFNIKINNKIPLAVVQYPVTLASIKAPAK